MSLFALDVCAICGESIHLTPKAAVRWWFHDAPCAKGTAHAAEPVTPEVASS